MRNKEVKQMYIEMGKRYRDPETGFEGTASSLYQGRVYLVATGGDIGDPTMVRWFDADKVEEVPKTGVGDTDARDRHRFK